MSLHTKWPWRLTETFVEAHHGSPSRWVCEITCADNNLIVAEIPEYRTYPEEAAEVEANARLIAAAPEVLSALQGLMEHGMTEARLDNARRAIAKATQPAPAPNASEE